MNLLLKQKTGNIPARPDRQEFWERNSLSIDIWSEKVFIQQLNYIHNHPVKHSWNLVQHNEEYKYSSAKFYEPD